jgi:hypothetical protein
MSQQVELKHQDFIIDNVQRSKVVRQDRYYPEQSQHKIKINDNIFSVDNYAAFGLSICSTNLNFEKNQTYQATYYVNEVEISNIDLSFVRKHDDQKIAFSILGQPLSVEAIQAVEQSKKILSKLSLLENDFAEVPISFKHSTYELRAWLQILEEHVNSLEKNTFELSTKDLTYFEEGIVQTIVPYLVDKIPLFAKQLTIDFHQMSEKQVKKCYEFLRINTGEYFYKSAYGHRAYHKPRGYAGDYEMMNNVYMNDLRGVNLFGKCMQRVFTDSSAGKAVRNRANYMLEKILANVSAKGKIRVLSVASGPAKEIQKFYKHYPQLADQVEIHLIDQDEEALKNAQREILQICRQSGVQPNLHFHNLAIKNIINEGLTIGHFDLIYSAGLFDYFTDPVAQFAANRLFANLNANGQLVIGNFNTNNPTQFIMEALGDWYLIYRTSENLKTLFSKTSTNLKIESEPEGVNLFAVIEK